MTSRKALNEQGELKPSEDLYRHCSIWKLVTVFVTTETRISQDTKDMEKIWTKSSWKRHLRSLKHFWWKACVFQDSLAAIYSWFSNLSSNYPICPYVVKKYEVMPGRQVCDGVLPGFTMGFEEEEWLPGMILMNRRETLLEFQWDVLVPNMCRKWLKFGGNLAVMSVFLIWIFKGSFLNFKLGLWKTEIFTLTSQETAYTLLWILSLQSHFGLYLTDKKYMFA